MSRTHLVRVIVVAGLGRWGFEGEAGLAEEGIDEAGPALDTAQAAADQALAPGGVTAAADPYGTETAEAALALGVPPGRITTITAGPNPPGGVHATRGGADASPADLDRITGAILAGKITVPIAATFPIERVRDAVEPQSGRHVHGKIVITL